MSNLAPRHLEYIAKYNGLRQQFTELFRSTFQLENPKFLLAVVDYKKNPKWDSCMSIFHLYIREQGGGRLAGGNGKVVVSTQDRVNLPGSVTLDIQAKMRGRSSQVGGMGDPNIFDDAFSVVVRATNAQHNMKERIGRFIDDHHINAASSGAFSRFNLKFDATLPP